MHAGGSQVPSFQQKRENFEFAHSGMLPRNEPSTPDFLLVVPRCPGLRASRSAKATGRGHRVCESTVKRIFRVLAKPIVKYESEINLKKCPKEVPSGSDCIFMHI
jgi:hypothetical protein